MSVVARAFERSDEVVTGLQSHPKKLPSRLLYDAHGADLFEQITQLDEYYPTRCELRLLDAHLPAIAADVGVAARVIEPGSVVSIKTKRLLRALDRPAMYIGVDVARDALEYGTKVLRAEHRDLDVHALVADFTRPFALPSVRRPIGKTLVFFTGSTIGNFEPHEAVAFLSSLQRVAGTNARLLLGADGTRDPETLVPAYDDGDGVTARFAMNALAHLNRTRGASFDPGKFRYRAIWNEMYSRVEMQLVSQCDQLVRVGGDDVRFRTGEPLVTEYSYKHTPHAMRGILLAAGWHVRQVFTATEQPMRLWLCEPRTV
ncbi:MAG TPA: L-histidine N(alpha)-methyltransferase [Kofleriaceae bacterium]|nr:L-histidine N(alpha)-methyltransferase [Kofleriaceae bacterium]